MIELKPCPFCGGDAKLSFADVEFGGMNYSGDKKVKYRFQVICNRCHSRGKPVKTEWLINPNPWGSLWSGRNYEKTNIVEQRTEQCRQWAEEAIAAWNRRADNDLALSNA